MIFQQQFITSRVMPAQTVIKMGHPTLRQIGKVLTLEEIKSEQNKLLIVDLIDTMRKEGGVGIAAPQINISKQVCIIEVPEYSERYGKLTPIPLTVFINPKIQILDPQLQGFWEGCLSIPGIRGYVERPRKVQVTYLNQFAEEKVLIAQGFSAVVCQHQLDHLFGNLFIDKIVSKKIAFIEEFKQFGMEKTEKVLDD